MRIPGGFTVVDVFRALGLDPTPPHTWSAGARLRQAYLAETGHLPHKDNRQKTSGGGSHCFAIYPPIWWLRARKIVIATNPARNPQQSLFDDEGQPCGS